VTLSPEVSNTITKIAHQYIGRPYDYKTFDCIHFIVNVYRDAGIIIPRFGGSGFPPEDLNLSTDEFEKMPLGQTVFFKRKESMSSRVWTHAAIIVSPHELIHCTRHFGGRVAVTPKHEFVRIYTHVSR
jgi:cell wall-associated NlpC family hydrolase